MCSIYDLIFSVTEGVLKNISYTSSVLEKNMGIQSLPLPEHVDFKSQVNLVLNLEKIDQHSCIHVRSYTNHTPARIMCMIIDEANSLKIISCIYESISHIFYNGCYYLTQRHLVEEIARHKDVFFTINDNTPLYFFMRLHMCASMRDELLQRILCFLKDIIIPTLSTMTDTPIVDYTFYTIDDIEPGKVTVDIILRDIVVKNLSLIYHITKYFKYLSYKCFSESIIVDTNTNIALARLLCYGNRKKLLYDSMSRIGNEFDSYHYMATDPQYIFKEHQQGENMFIDKRNVGYYKISRFVKELDKTKIKDENFYVNDSMPSDSTTDDKRSQSQQYSDGIAVSSFNTVNKLLCCLHTILFHIFQNFPFDWVPLVDKSIFEGPDRLKLFFRGRFDLESKRCQGEHGKIYCFSLRLPRLSSKKFSYTSDARCIAMQIYNTESHHEFDNTNINYILLGRDDSRRSIFLHNLSEKMIYENLDPCLLEQCTTSYYEFVNDMYAMKHTTTFGKFKKTIELLIDMKSKTPEQDVELKMNNIFNDVFSPFEKNNGFTTLNYEDYGGIVELLQTYILEKFGCSLSIRSGVVSVALTKRYLDKYSRTKYMLTFVVLVQECIYCHTKLHTHPSQCRINIEIYANCPMKQDINIYYYNIHSAKERYPILNHKSAIELKKYVLLLLESQNIFFNKRKTQLTKSQLTRMTVNDLNQSWVDYCSHVLYDIIATRKYLSHNYNFVHRVSGKIYIGPIRYMEENCIKEGFMSNQQLSKGKTLVIFKRLNIIDSDGKVRTRSKLGKREIYYPVKNVEEWCIM